MLHLLLFLFLFRGIVAFTFNASTAVVAFIVVLRDRVEMLRWVFRPPEVFMLTSVSVGARFVLVDRDNTQKQYLKGPRPAH